MADEQHLSLIDDAFSNFRDDGPMPAPLGTTAVRTTVRRRQRVRVMTAGALAALAIAAPITAYATGRLDSNGPPSVPGTTATASGSPSTEPTTATPARAAPDGRISQADLLKATVDLPRWTTRNPADANSCGGKGIKFSTDWRHQGTLLVKVVHVDIDNDGAQETMALINCVSGEIGEMAVVGFDRDASGAIVTMGLAVSSEISGSTKGLPEEIADIRVVGNTVEAKLGDLKTCCSEHEEPMTQYHWRGYSWNGTAFAQVSGPTQTPQNTRLTDLSVKVNGFQVKAGATGTLTATIRNAGPTAQVPVIWVHLPEGMKLKSSPNTCVDADEPGLVRCYLPKLQVGGEATLKVEVTGPAVTFAAGTSFETLVEVRTNITDGDHDDRAYYGDAKSGDNDAKVAVTVTA